MYDVYLERAAERDLKRLSASDFDQVVAAMRALADNPKPDGCRKIVTSENDWRIRIGDYRVIYEIDEKAKAVRVMRIRHRDKAYRQR